LGDRTQKYARHTVSEVLAAPPAAHNSDTSTFGEPTPGQGIPKYSAALLPAACGRPVTDENNQNSRFISGTTDYNS